MAETFFLVVAILTFIGGCGLMFLALQGLLIVVGKVFGVEFED